MPNAIHQHWPLQQNAPADAGGAAETSDARDLAARLRAAVATLDADALAGLFAPDGAFDFPFASPDGPRSSLGREAIRAHFRARWAAPLVRVEAIHDVVHDTSDPALVLSQQVIATRLLDTGAPRELVFVLGVRVHQGAIAWVGDYAGALAPARGREGPPGVVMTSGGRGAVVVRRYFEMWKAGDFTAADGVLDPRYVDHAHPQLVGPSAVAAIAARFRAQNPTGELSVDEIVAHGDLVAARTSLRGASGTNRCLALFHVLGGRIVEHWAVHRAPPKPD